MAVERGDKRGVGGSGLQALVVEQRQHQQRPALEQRDGGRVVRVLHLLDGQPLALVLGLQQRDGRSREVRLQLLVCKVDEQLLEA
eukprot:scaffold12375_cov101-Isochrysis_galbana.AAC.1